MSEDIVFDADQLASDREARGYKIGAATFHAVRVTPRVMRDIRQISRKVADIEKAHGEESSEAQDANADGMIDQLQLLLRGAQGKPPARKVLEEELDIRELQTLVMKVMGADDEQNPSLPPATPAGTSTTT